jgi:hypothetical protein
MNSAQRKRKPAAIITMARVWIFTGHRIRATTGEPLEVII